MATVSSPRAARSATLRSVPAGLRRALPGLVCVVGVAALFALVFRPDALNYDARYCLLWARDVLQGLRPDYIGAFAPTPHPLQTAVAFLALAFGDAADDVMTGLILLSFGGLVWAAYRLGAQLGTTAVGVVAALVVLTRVNVERYAMFGYQDLTFAMLVVLAVWLEVRRPRRGAPVLALLALAGLVRPDAWLLAGLYLLWAWRAATPRGRALHLALVLAAPLLWAAQDWLVTGDPLHSLHGTSGLAAETNRVRDPERVPIFLASYLRYMLREPLVLGLPVGLVFAWRHVRRSALVPLAVAVVLLGWAVLQALGGLPFVMRYTLTPAALLAVLYALGTFGWQLLPEGTARRRWQTAGLVSLALSVAFLPWHLRHFAVLERHMDVNSTLLTDLREVGEAPAVRERFAACGTISSIGHRPVPHLRFWLDGPPGSVRTVEGVDRRVGPLVLKPGDARGVWRFYRTQFSRVALPPGYRQVFANRSWRVLAAPGCGGSVLPAAPGGAGAPDDSQDA